MGSRIALQPEAGAEYVHVHEAARLVWEAISLA
jgi:hypothetical protein